MKIEWEENNHLLDEINNAWKRSEEAYKSFEKQRQEAANILESLIQRMIEAAKKSHDTLDVKAIPVIEKGSMIGLQLIINGVYYEYAKNK